MPKYGVLVDFLVRHGTAAATVGALGFIAVLMVVPNAPRPGGDDPVRTLVWECHPQGGAGAGASLELVRSFGAADFVR